MTKASIVRAGAPLPARPLRQLSLLIRSKSGRYMLMTMPPTVDAQEHDHDRFQQRQQVGHRLVDLLLVEVGDLGEHRVERARLLADADHLHHHRREDAALLQGLGERHAALHGLAHGHDRVFDDRVAGGPGGDLEAVEDRHAGRDEGRERAAEARHRDLLHDEAEDRELEDDAVDGAPPAVASRSSDAAGTRRRPRTAPGRAGGARTSWTAPITMRVGSGSCAPRPSNMAAKVGMTFQRMTATTMPAIEMTAIG